jgi:hypothetical protein
VAPSELLGLWCATTETASYAFRCPRCLLAVSHQTGEHVLEVLVAAGVEVGVWELPAELHEAHPGPRLDASDVARFTELLSGEGWLERAVCEAAGAGAPDAWFPAEPDQT